MDANRLLQICRDNKAAGTRLPNRWSKQETQNWFCVSIKKKTEEEKKIRRIKNKKKKKFYNVTDQIDQDVKMLVNLLIFM